MSPKLLYQIALTQINGIGDITARNLLDVVGDEEEIFKSSKKVLCSIKGLANHLAEEILKPEVLTKAEKELEFVLKNKLQTFFVKDSNYPMRLRECADSPTLFYFKGNANLDSQKIISIVGTRKSTHYGDNFCDSFLEEIAQNYPDTLIVSVLAYGIDIITHKACLKYNLPTVGVLAHGLDRIYPATHRKTAIEMLENGGLLTEFPSGTEPDRFNFVRRNRIVAGMSDATIVVESDVKGGSLITADIANSYSKEVFAVPGRISDPQSKGCNKLIWNNKASILQSASDFIEAMSWENSNGKKIAARQKELFLDLSSEEQKIYDALNKVDNLHVNLLSTEVEIPVSQLFSTLLELEMRGIIKPLPGGVYTLL